MSTDDENKHHIERIPYNFFILYRSPVTMYLTHEGI